MLVFWGDGSQLAKDLVDAIVVRSTENFNWTFIFILAVVFYVYWSEIHKKEYKVVFAGLALYGVHWLYEIVNAIIGHFAGYPLWSVSNESTTFILLVGVCWELSMMFSIAGIISYKMLPADPKARYFAKGGRKGISAKLAGALGMALLFALVESFLAGLQVVGCASRLRDHLHSVLPGSQLRARLGAEKAYALPGGNLGAGCRSTGRAHSHGHHLITRV